MSGEFDVIVVGAGMSGGWAAKEMCEKGYKTLVLDRGTETVHGDYVNEGKAPWDMPNRGEVSHEERHRDYYMNTKCYAFSEYSKQHFLKDSDYPYSYPDDKEFQWIRPAAVGGKSLMWARHSYRWSDLDFGANKKDGHGNDWPIRYADLKPWYDYVERFAGISGTVEGIPQLPDGIFQPPVHIYTPEKDIGKKINAVYPDRHVIPGRVAHLTEPTEEQLDLGRGICQARNQCERGCSFGAYFSSVAATLPAAENTGNLTLRPNSAVHSVIYDEKTGKASGVKVVDTETQETHIFKARVVFMCASTLGTTQILLNSRSKTFENGIGNSSGVLGHYLMDHIGGYGASGRIEGYNHINYTGRRQGSIFIPRFVNVDNQDKDFLRGYGYQGSASRGGWRGRWNGKGIGKDFKESISKVGDWYFGIYGFGEMLPRHENKVTIDPNLTDKNGIPALHIDCEYSENERKMGHDIRMRAEEMLKAAGLKDVSSYSNDNSKPGIVIHEVGTARMGNDPRESYLNKYNQCHDVPNLFVTDGASFCSVAWQNPSLTFMAITARAADHADKLLKAGTI